MLTSHDGISKGGTMNRIDDINMCFAIDFTVPLGAVGVIG